jgi:TPR repeat protein
VVVRAAAEKRDVTAQLKLAVRYKDGDGVQHSSAEAAMWFQRAADQGDAEAQYCYAICLFHGEGVTKDEAAAAAMWRKAAEQGHAKAQEALNAISTPMRAPRVASSEAASAALAAASPEDMRRWIAAAEAGDVHALYLCAHAHSLGIAGQVQSDERAASLARRAAEQGHAPSQNSLGWALEQGRG